jgi:hypothetical protein
MARNTGMALVDPGLALYDGRVARGEMAAIALLDRINGTAVAVRDRYAARILKSKYGDDPEKRKEAEAEASELLGKDDHVDFFHFRQCRMAKRKTPTMSWHDSTEAWDAMRAMTGLEPEKGDECGNAAEFFRLCTRLARLTGAAADDEAAMNYCMQQRTPAKPWVRPAGWKCIDSGTPGRKMCGIYK